MTDSPNLSLGPLALAVFSTPGNHHEDCTVFSVDRFAPGGGHVVTRSLRPTLYWQEERASPNGSTAGLSPVPPAWVMSLGRWKVLVTCVPPAPPELPRWRLRKEFPLQRNIKVSPEGAAAGLSKQRVATPCCLNVTIHLHWATKWYLKI